MWSKDNTSQNKLTTRYFSPNELQIKTAVRGEDRFVPRRRLSLFQIALLLIGIQGIALFLIIFVLVRALG